MFIGNIQPSNFFLGSSQVNEIWLGSLKVWQRVDEYTCTIDNVSVYYFKSGASSGNSLLPDASNYATVSGRVRIYKNGVLETSYTTIQLDVTSTSPYVTIADNDIEFNITSYGTSNMSSMSNPFYIDVKTSFSGYTGPVVQVAITPNLVASTSSYSRVNSGTTSVAFLNYNQTSFSITNRNKETTRTTYTSGKYSDSVASVGGYIFQMDTQDGSSELVTAIGANSTYTINIGSTNTGSYPKVYVYRLSHTNGTTGYDDWIYMMQKSSSNTSGLKLYYNDRNVDGTYVESSTFFYLANNGHTASSTYTWSCDDSSIVITQEGGIFKFDNVTSSTDCSVTIKDNNGNTCDFDILGS